MNTVLPGPQWGACHRRKVVMPGGFDRVSVSYHKGHACWDLGAAELSTGERVPASEIWEGVITPREAQGTHMEL